MQLKTEPLRKKLCDNPRRTIIICKLQLAVMVKERSDRNVERDYIYGYIREQKIYADRQTFWIDIKRDEERSFLHLLLFEAVKFFFILLINTRIMSIERDCTFELIDSSPLTLRHMKSLQAVIILTYQKTESIQISIQIYININNVIGLVDRKVDGIFSIQNGIFSNSTFLI